MNTQLKFNLKPFASLFLMLTFVVCGYAQRKPTEAIYKKVMPGDSVVDAARITPHKIKYQKGSFEMIYDLRKVKKNAKKVYEMRIYFGSENATPDKIYFDAENLSYIGRRLEVKNYTIDVKYDKGKFTGNLTPAKDSKYTPRKYDKTYSHTFFEPAIVNYFIAALPLKEGYKASVPTIDLNDGSKIWWANIEVLGREKIDSNGKTYDTWKVSSKGIKDKTIWISTSHPYAVKMVTKGSSGSWMVNDSIDGINKSMAKSLSNSKSSVTPTDPLEFFAGTWKRDGMDGFEKWERKGAMEFSGEGYKITNGGKQPTETMAIKSENGNVFFVATLLTQGDGKPIKLAFTGASRGEFSFENKESPVIRKLVYRRVSDSEMVVQLTGADGNSFSYRLNKQ